MRLVRLVPVQPLQILQVQVLVLTSSITIALCDAPPRHFEAPATAELLLAPQAGPHGAAGEPRESPRYCAR
eukprot:COSAG06_NODE_1404_length_9558_cov_191.769955_1_plen_71_part_00